MKRFLFVFILLCFFPISSVSAHHPDTEEEQLIIVNKRTNKLAFYDHGTLVKILPVATGRTSTLTPEGTFHIMRLNRNMPYYAKNIPGGAPNNPLGDRWIGLDVPGTQGFTYGIHGTNAPWSIGTNASSGCVRMHNEDVRWLYSKMHYNAMVFITNSDKEFDELAASKGYKILQSEPFESDINLMQGIKAYAEDNFYSTSHYIQTGVVHTTVKKGNWLSILLDGKNNWIHTTKYATGTLTKKSEDLLLSEKESVYRYPNTSNSIIGEIPCRFVTSFEETSDGWKHIVTSEYGEVWIHPTNS